MNVTHCCGSDAIVASRSSKSVLILARSASRSSAVCLVLRWLVVLWLVLGCVATVGPPIPADVAAGRMGPRGPILARRHVLGPRGHRGTTAVVRLKSGGVWCRLVLPALPAGDARTRH